MATTDLAPEVSDLKQRRLAQLVERRETLGRQWAERVSHNRPGSEVLAYELAVVERAITEQWPGESSRWVQAWIVTDANRLHDTTEHHPECRYCAAAHRPARAA
ncbi:MAG TPA: hypothetical protein VIH37_10450 [Candidatus Limnocylindrales bacterium]